MGHTSLPNRRATHFSDRVVQGAVVLHVIAHWLAFLLMAAGLLLFMEMVSTEPRDVLRNMLRRHAPTLLVMLALAPIFLHDLCRLTNRFVGPMIRLRRAMRSLAEGDNVAPIRFREGDFWPDLVADFNRVSERLQASTAAARSRHSVDDDNQESHPERLSRIV